CQYEWAKQISEHLLPRTRADAEICLDPEQVATTAEEPRLRQPDLPRKYKPQVVSPPQNELELPASDITFVAIAAKGQRGSINQPG
ncbi:sulfite reductase subunit beta, partial [Escherichia coli]